MIAGRQQSNRWLIIVRVSWCVVALMVLGLVIASVLSVVEAPYTLHPVAHTVGLCEKCAGSIPVQPVQGDQPAQAMIPLWYSVYALYCLILCVVFALSCFVVAGVLTWRKPDNRMAMFAAFFLALLAVMFCDQLPTLSSFWHK
ncbi:MAG TPA: hypothetical protein VH593_01205, partial [Ktedonobacteraceae bacterium]